MRKGRHGLESDGMDYSCLIFIYLFILSSVNKAYLFY